MGKTALIAQLVTSHNWTETCFSSPQLRWLRKIRSVEKFWLPMKQMN